jgi:hypothetical protein
LYCRLLAILPLAEFQVSPEAAGSAGRIKTPFQLILKIITNLCLTNDHMRQRLQQALVYMRFSSPGDGVGAAAPSLSIADIVAADKMVAFYCNLLGIMEAKGQEDC